LHKRNEYLINSHLPLRQTLKQQIGKDEPKRIQFLQESYITAKTILIHEWEPEPKGTPTF